MIAFVRGRLEATGTDYAVVEAGGIGYMIFAPRRVLSNLGPPGSETCLHTHLYVREDALTLYGFASVSETRLFVTLLSVAGIGPKVALNMLSSASPEELQHAIAAGDTRMLARVPGIGQKTAARLVLELKGKLDSAAFGAIGEQSAAAGVNADLAEMLLGLGFSTAEAAGAIASLPADAPLDLEERLRLALSFFGGA